MDSAVTAMSTDAPNSRPNSSSSNSKKILTVVNHNHHKSAFSLANANNSNNNSNNSSQSPIDPSFQQPALPSFLGIGRSMSSSQKHSTSSSKPHHGGNSSSGNSFSTRRSKQPRNHGFSSSGVPSTPSAAMASGALPQTFTPEIGTKNPSCHLSRPEFPMPMTTGKASTTRNKGFNFDMMDTAPPSTHSSHHNSSNTIANLIASPRKETPRGEKSSGMTPRRLPSLEPPHTFTSQSTDSPRLSEPPAMKRQSSAGSSSVSFHHSVDKGESNSYHRNSSQSSIHLNNEGSQKIPFLPSRKNQLPPATSLGPPYPTTVMVYDESPRLMIPPHRQQQILQQQGVVNTTDYAQLVSSNDVNIYNTMIERPKSAEKKRWLARMNLLQEDLTSTQKIKSMADADDTASQIALNGGKYYYIEYMDWMGKDLFSNRHNAGDVICPGCKNALGHWTWTPSQRLLLDGRLEAPLFRIHKHVVHHTEFDFDATPSSTPRPPEDLNNNPM
eukprot:gene6246-6722_t